MNQQKVEQAFKQIFEKCEDQLIQNHPAFKSAVFDLLDSTRYADELLVLKHAMDSDSFWILLETSQLTSDSAQKAVTQIQKESHMAQEDAEFVVQCVATARGINPDTVYPKHEEELKVEVDPEPKVEPNPQPEEKWDFETKCRIIANGNKNWGKIYLYQNKLSFNVDGIQNSTNTIFYHNIEKLQLFKKRTYAAGIAIVLIVLMCMSPSVYLDVGGALLLGILVWYCFTRRKRIKINQGNKKSLLLVLKNYDDKMQIVQFLKKQGVSVS